MKFLFLAILLISLILYEKIWRKNKCIKKINVEIKNRNGEVISIEKVSSREEIYIVYYEYEGVTQNSTVIFNLFYDMSWK